MTEKPLVNNYYTLAKLPGKGGWTYAMIPEMKQDKHKPFGWVRVKGSIDGVAIKNYHLMPMGNGHLFLPVKAAIRKQIKKQAGDSVLVCLFTDDAEVEIPDDIMACFDDEPGSYDQYSRYSRGEQKAFIEWIEEAKTDDTKTKRIVKMFDLLKKGKKLSDKPSS